MEPVAILIQTEQLVQIHLLFSFASYTKKNESNLKIKSIGTAGTGTKIGTGQSGTRSSVLSERYITNT